jgi:two-component system phosphate regulon sensor histidine kinase PhoR
VVLPPVPATAGPTLRAVDDRARPTVTGRLLIRYAATAVALLAAVALLLSLVQAPAPILAVAAVAAAAAITVAVLSMFARRTAAQVRATTDVVARMSTGDLTTRAPVGGTTELALLGDALNRMAAELDAGLEEARRDRRQREAILSSMQEGVILVGADDRLGYSNRAAARLLGGVPGELRSLTPPAVRSLVEETRRANSIQHGEVETGLPPRILGVSAVPLQTPGQVLVVVRDVTAARRVEAMRRDFVADASHELKTPAAALQAAAETVERAVHDDPEAAVRFAGQMRRDAERLSAIVSDLLDLSRLETERPNLEPLRLDPLVADEVDRVRPRAREAGLDLRVDLDAVTVAGASRDLRLLARNLLDNAMQYASPGDRVSVELGARDGVALLVVQDTGMGIPSRDLPRIFERFYRVDRARSRDTGGTGLGLSIARHVAERHGGRIEAESELGRGSTFRVAIPLAPSGGAAEA